MNVHQLGGCGPTPLLSYLKALGILRLVAEQADTEARGWWEGERFVLATRLDQSGLVSFLADQYEPTPMFNPWGGRSGFYPGSSEKSAREVLKAIEATTSSRFAQYRKTLAIIKTSIEQTSHYSKPGQDLSDLLVLRLRNSLRGKALLWMDAVTSVVGSGTRVDVEKPALFGTGGNEGSGSYTSAYMAALDQCLVRWLWHHALPTALFARGPSPGCKWGQSMGQFLPSGAATPWDLLLAFEGACTLTSAVSSRNTTESGRWTSSPFYVAPCSYAYPSAARLDEYALNKGKELPGRGEQWFPLWNQPMSYDEVRQMFVEGRATTARGRAIDGWSMVRAVTSLGVRQGIREFVRYGYQQRNNLATHLAVPLGRFRVPDRNCSSLACLDDLDRWLRALRRDAHSRHAPDRLAKTERRLSEALFAVTQHPDEPTRWQAVLLHLADIEGVLRTALGLRIGPVPPLRPEWVKAADDGSSEFRLALACALQVGTLKEGQKPDTVRRHWLPLKGLKFAVSETAGQPRIQMGPEVVILGRRGIDDAISLVQRRLVEAAQGGQRTLPLFPARWASADRADLAQLLAGQVDVDRTMHLARAFTAISSRHWTAHPYRTTSPRADVYPEDAWLAVRLALSPWPLPDGRTIAGDPAIVRRLHSGDAFGATKTALERLVAAGIKATVRLAAVGPATARLWAAALAFPIGRATAAHFLHRIDANSMKEKSL